MPRRIVTNAGIAKNPQYMHDDEKATPQPSWQVRLANLRAKPALQGSTPICGEDLNAEALMTIISIMKDNDDPKLQMAAAKMLLDKNVKAPAALLPVVVAPENPSTPDDIDAAIALAKAVLDELAGRKAQGVDGAREVDIVGAPTTDNSNG